MKDILVLGGTRFFGKELVKELIKSGHNITILTRGNIENPFKGKVKHIKANRRNENELKNAIEGLSFDTVYDNICYSPNDALISTKVFKGKIKRYIVTSSLAVYENKSIGLEEREFNARKYEIKQGNKEEFSYAEGKRLVEAVFAKYAEFEVALVRFPVVIGEEDYTGRLQKYVHAVIKEEKIYAKNLDKKMNLITSSEAAIFLKWLLNKEINGPINAACFGDLSLDAIIKIIEEESGEKAIVDTTIDVDETSPYNKFLGMTLSTVYMRGFFLYRFKDARSETRNIIKYFVREEKKQWTKILQKQ